MGGIGIVKAVVNLAEVHYGGGWFTPQFMCLRHIIVGFAQW